MALTPLRTLREFRQVAAFKCVAWAGLLGSSLIHREWWSAPFFLWALVDELFGARGIWPTRALPGTTELQLVKTPATRAEPLFALTMAAVGLGLTVALLTKDSDGFQYFFGVAYLGFGALAAANLVRLSRLKSVQ